MMEQKKTPLVAVVGPTASGKTWLAVELAKHYQGEVVSADSMQVYREMDIATAKPTLEEQQGIPHHLVDFLPPDNPSFSVADYAKLAHEAISQIHSRGHLPILAGGTGLYVDAVVDNLDFSPIASDPQLRQQLRQLGEERGAEYLHRLLEQVDPDCAARLHPQNQGRVIRALEVYRLTGIPMSEHQRRSRLVPSQYASCLLGLGFRDRARLYERIDRRVDEMLRAGLLEEARRICGRYGGTARQAIGYKELQPFLAGEAPLEACVERLKQATRNYAKRQLTWFRHNPLIHWLWVDEAERPEDLLKNAQNVIHKELHL